MLKNHFKTAWRNLLKHKGFSFINIMGLTVGLTACYLIALYVHFESTYDAFNTKSDRIYRLVTDLITPSEKIHTAMTSWAYAPNIQNDFPEVEKTVRVSGGSFLITKGDIKFQEENALFADSALFEVFDFKMIKGDPKTALKAPLSIVFTETGAKKYFGKSDPVGQSILFSGDMRPARVTGLIKDMPENSQVKTDMLISMSTQTGDAKFLEEQWGNFGPTTFILLKEGAKAESVVKKFPAFMLKHNRADMEKMKMNYILDLEPIKEVYLQSDRDNSQPAASNVYTFSVIAIFILLIACINFINLSTARSVERAKEVGIRKVAGALKSQLNRQFIAESVLPCLIAFVFSVLLSALFLPLFNQVAGKTISTGIFQNPEYLLILFGASVIIGLLAGIYPALVLSSFKPILVLKGRFTTSSNGTILRKGLVIGQFTISIALIIATIIVYNQMNFMRSQDLGFSKDQMIVVKTQGDKGKETFKESLSRIPGVKGVSLSAAVPGGGNANAYSKLENSRGEMQVTGLDLYFVDFDYIPLYKLKMAAGRAFSKEFLTDTTQAMIINEAALKLLGYTDPQQAVGKKFDQWGRTGQIVGVVKDFHFRSLQEQIKPLTMRIEPGAFSFVSVNVDGKNVSKTIAAIEDQWESTVPARPFSYFFLDEFYNKQYQREERFGKLFFNFSILAIFISCLGLLGLASYSTLQRTKEIGVRKVLGASVATIVNLLSRDFLKLVLVSFIIAAPVSWYFMNKWLERFAYQTSIYWWIFILAGVLAFMIALVTISFQAIKAAIANPVRSLRAE